ncbi:hypothetical protein GO013_13500 [Pseudodesulfovibrio sp. JC047]|uniref:hypothetical protein n=1 Tax=Pseudodesulfovibrio sp. JC047 TaxID=2683199 RepID=UPI0013D6A830|nr:hypothetical protein [Pseudodesulfovibrio sp. JC047]NDV20425.1 hypothetical protein [Pseudodesulfovibrio sp. JC047]
MKTFAVSAVLAAFLTGAFFVSAALAQEPTVATEVAIATPTTLPKVSSTNLPAYLDHDLARKHADFTRFAKVRVKAMDENHRLSKSRMMITKLSDGRYKALYHAIDHETVICKVRRSSSKTIPYVAVLSYQEMVMAAIGSSPEECRSGEFIPVSIIPNRQIFSHKKGRWQ